MQIWQEIQGLLDANYSKNQIAPFKSPDIIELNLLRVKGVLIQGFQA